MFLLVGTVTVVLLFTTLIFSCCIKTSRRTLRLSGQLPRLGLPLKRFFCCFVTVNTLLEFL